MSGERGLSLIEVLVAVTIFTLVAAAVTSLTTSALSTADWNKDRAHAMAIAESEIEDMRSIPYGQMANQFQFVFRGGRRFGVSRIVTRDQPAPNMADLTVAVTWSQRGGRTHTYQARTIVTALGQGG